MPEVVVKVKGEDKQYRFKNNEPIENIKTIVGLNSMRDKLNREMSFAQQGPQSTQTIETINNYIRDVASGKIAREGLKRIDQMLIGAQSGDSQAINELLGEVLPGGALTTKAARKAEVEIIDAIKRTNEGFDDFGLRVIPFGREVKVGDKLQKSFKWVDGEKTTEQLLGTSTIGVKTENVKEALSLIKKGGYQGDQIAIVKGGRVSSGEDIGEAIIEDAEVVSIFNKTILNE